MSIKLMTFIDGSWLFHNLNHLRETFQDPDYIIDYRKLPKIIVKHLEEYTNDRVDIVRIHFFGAMPVNKIGFDPTSQRNFFDFLEKECHYTMEIYDIDFKNSPEIRPEEKCVDIALATSMTFFAMTPGAFDVAALVAGDLDYMPLLQRVRDIGKRTLLVAMKPMNAYAPSSDKLINNYSLFDFPVLFIDDCLDDLRLVREKKLRTCEGCGEKKFTYWDGPNFYCPNCLAERSNPVRRTCRSCGKENETFWKGEIFYCNDCREKYRTGKW